MKIELRFFASVREALGIAEEIIDLPPHVRTVGDVRAFLMGRGGIWFDVLAPEKALRMAYDHNMTGPETELAEGGEVAFFPPVTGG
ncbi:molybdopterin synthase sulfur carrier subunit [Herbaspirillum sp. Sphag1AN]|uniref:molybdopterin converting factor subunit 1 n=1 Tax=unclassified Herbaspirillum TaxID=2624150 RepID=UPI00161CD35F|nr:MULTISPECIES: molybdopterin converting factor subunit 1 [unclassified Herbaspirillum]MBB3212402.1 molybdopterin synthase sulfur carrier subunit [Herbaspirillum sp. Sphag1AN]MBB3245499.1 molybdopterin synthase sulfur carrier subunit [Herbaspirillum sp. Sphag64]